MTITNISNAASTAEAFASAGLNWSTELLDIHADRITADSVQRIDIPTRKAHVRSDNGGLLGVVSDRYSAITNAQLAEFADTICGLDAAPRCVQVACWNGGRRVAAVLELPRTHHVRVAGNISGDKTVGRIVLVNSHDGSAALQAKYMNVRLACQNQLPAIAANSDGVTIRHVGDADAKLEDARLVLQEMQREHEYLTGVAHTLAQHRLSDRAHLDRLFRCAYYGAFPSADIDGDGREKYLDTVAAWNVAHVHETNREIAHTAWGALNAITYWVDHVRSRTSDQSKMVGAASRIKAAAARAIEVAVS